jgi:prophage regulatory protein
MKHESTAVTPNTPSARRVSRLPQVMARVGYKDRVTIWRKVQCGEFPAPIQLGPNAIGWFDDEVDAWLESRPRVKHSASVEDAHAAA